MRKNSFSAETSHKIILLGDSNVGKTSLANRWLCNSYESSTRPTIGATNTLKTIEIDSQPVNISLWDTAGQEQYRAIAPLYVRKAKVAIIVTSACVEASFDSIQFWKNTLSNTGSDEIKIILAVNKIDLIDSDDRKLVDLIEKYKEGFDELLLVSAKTGENVENLFLTAAKMAISININQEKQPIPVFSDENKKSCC